MTTTFMISAHADPEMLRRLVVSLESSRSRIIVHVDRKSDKSVFQAALASTSARLTEWSLPVWWGDFGSCRVALRMLRAAVQDGSERYFFLSGSHYPIKSLDEILRMNGTPDLIRVDRKLCPASSDWFSRRAFGTHFMSNGFVNPRTAWKPVRRVVEFISNRWRRGEPGITVYQGPAWWALSRETAHRALAFIKSNPKVETWMRWCYIPDEILFQTLVKAVASRNLSQDATLQPLDQGLERVHGTTYVDFAGFSPKVLTLEDLPHLVASCALFARKFDSEKSAGLIEAIDANIL